MKSSRLLTLSLLVFTFSSLSLKAQSTVDAAISNLYESITFNKTREPDFEKFRALFVDGAFLISVKDTTFYKLSVEEFIKNMNRQRKSGSLKAFREYEISRKMDQYGNIAHVFSTYKTNIETAEGSINTRGINSIQLLRKDGQWKITALIWYEENDKYLLPGKYLPKSMDN